MAVYDSILLNDSDSIKYRRNSNTLVILGVGVIVYGFWSVIKILTYLLLSIPIYDTAELEDFTSEDVKILMIFLSVFLAGDVIVRLIVGLNAIAEGRGRKRRFKGYLFFNVWEILFGMFSVSAVVYEMICLEDYEVFLDSYLSIFMELTSLAMLVEVFIAALIVRRYKATHIMENT